MPLVYNVGQKGVVIPNVLSRIYRYSSWKGNTLIQSGNIKIVINPKERIDRAWTFIETNCARNRKCNSYFASLRKRKTLSDILKNVTFTVHELVPKQGVPNSKLPEANSAGKDFALSIFAFLESGQVKENSDQALAAVILHEIAHYAGASTYVTGKGKLEAENALLHCGLKRFHNPDAKG